MARKQANIYPRAKQDGSTVYDTMLTLRDPATGKRKQKMVTFPTLKAAKDALAQNRVDAARGQNVAAPKCSVADLLTEWLARKEVQVRPTTYRAYSNTLLRHVAPYLGGLAVEALTPRLIEQHYVRLRREGLGPLAIRAVHARLGEVLRYARRQQLIRENPIESVDRPPAQGHRHVIWDDEEISRFLAVAEQSSYGPIWIVALYTGMRRGELFGLRWQDIDEGAGVIHVRQQYTRAGGTAILGDPKCGSTRKVAVPSRLFRVLRAHRATVAEWRLRAGQQWRELELVLPNHWGRPISDWKAREDLNRLIAAAGVTQLTIHDLRHTHGSMMIRHGKNPAEVAARLGHKNPSLTLQVYTHAVPDEHKQTASDLERWLA